MGLMAVLGGIGVGVVTGWLLPVVWRAMWPAALASAVTVAIVLGALFGLAGISGSVGGLIGIAAGAWLHAAFRDYLTARAAKPKEA